MLSKWKFIGLWCLFKGERKLAKKAFEFEKFLKDTYGETITENWKTDIYREKLRMFYNSPIEIYYRIIISSSYCIACEISKHCNNCEFMKKFGFCDDLKSEFSKFKREFKEKFFT